MNAFCEHSHALFYPFVYFLEPEAQKPTHSVRGKVIGVNPTVDGVFGYAQVGNHVCDIAQLYSDAMPINS